MISILKLKPGFYINHLVVNMLQICFHSDRRPIVKVKVVDFSSRCCGGGGGGGVTGLLSVVNMLQMLWTYCRIVIGNFSGDFSICTARSQQV